MGEGWRPWNTFHFRNESHTHKKKTKQLWYIFLDFFWKEICIINFLPSLLHSLFINMWITVHFYSVISNLNMFPTFPLLWKMDDHSTLIVSRSYLLIVQITVCTSSMKPQATDFIHCLPFQSELIFKGTVSYEVMTMLHCLVFNNWVNLKLGTRLSSLLIVLRNADQS